MHVSDKAQSTMGLKIISKQIYLQMSNPADLMSVC